MKEINVDVLAAKKNIKKSYSSLNKKGNKIPLKLSRLLYLTESLV